MLDLKRKDEVYYARIIPSCNIYEVHDLTIRTVEEDWFVGIDKKDKHAFYFHDYAINNSVFLNRKDALKKVKDAEKQKVAISDETYYEEY